MFWHIEQRPENQDCRTLAFFAAVIPQVKWRHFRAGVIGWNPAGTKLSAIGHNNAHKWRNLTSVTFRGRPSSQPPTSFLRLNCVFTSPGFCGLRNMNQARSIGSRVSVEDEAPFGHTAFRCRLVTRTATSNSRPADTGNHGYALQVFVTKGDRRRRNWWQTGL